MCITKKYGILLKTNHTIGNVCEFIKNIVFDHSLFNFLVISSSLDLGIGLLSN